MSFTPENGRYEIGYLKAQLEGVASAIAEVKDTLEKLEEKISRELGWMRDEVTGIKLWRAKVIGASMVSAAIVSWIVDYIKAHFKGVG